MHIVVFFDGTWNDPDTNTNVWLLFRHMIAALDSEQIKASESANHPRHFWKRHEGEGCRVKMENKEEKKDDEEGEEDGGGKKYEADVVKLYFPGVGTGENKIESILQGATGEEVVCISEHAVSHVLAVMDRRQNAAGTVEFLISVVGFSRGSASATYFLNLMEDLLVSNSPMKRCRHRFRFHAALLYDRVVSIKSLDFLSPNWRRSNMSAIPAGCTVLHLVSSHDRRCDLLKEAFDPTLLPERILANADKALQMWMSGEHGDVGGFHNKTDKQTNFPQGYHPLTIGTSFLMNMGFRFTPAFLGKLKMASSDSLPRVFQNYGENDFVGIKTGKGIRDPACIRRTRWLFLADGKKFYPAGATALVPHVHESVFLRKDLVLKPDSYHFSNRNSEKLENNIKHDPLNPLMTSEDTDPAADKYHIDFLLRTDRTPRIQSVMVVDDNGYAWEMKLDDYRKSTFEALRSANLGARKKLPVPFNFSSAIPKPAEEEAEPVVVLPPRDVVAPSQPPPTPPPPPPTTTTPAPPAPPLQPVDDTSEENTIAENKSIVQNRPSFYVPPTPLFARQVVPIVLSQQYFSYYPPPPVVPSPPQAYQFLPSRRFAVVHPRSYYFN